MVAERRKHVGARDGDWPYTEFAGLFMGALPPSMKLKYCGDHEDILTRLRTRCGHVSVIALLWQVVTRCPDLVTAGYCNASEPESLKEFGQKGVPAGWAASLKGVCAGTCGVCKSKYGSALSGPPGGGLRSARRGFTPQSLAAHPAEPAPSSEPDSQAAPEPKAATGAQNNAEPHPHADPSPDLSAAANPSDNPEPKAGDHVGPHFVPDSDGIPRPPPGGLDSRPSRCADAGPDAAPHPAAAAPLLSCCHEPLSRVPTPPRQSGAQATSLDQRVQDLEALVSLLCWAVIGMGLTLIWLVIRQCSPGSFASEGHGNMGCSY